MSDGQATLAEITPPKAWRLAESALATMEMEKRPDGTYLLVVVTTNGTRWEADVTEPVHAAAKHEAAELDAQLKAALAQAQEVLAINQRWQAYSAEQERRIKEQDEELKTAQKFLRQFAPEASR